MKTILAPIDFSPGTRTVIARALTLARAMRGRLVLLHVIQPRPVAVEGPDWGQTTAGIVPAVAGYADPESACIDGPPLEDEITVSMLYAVGISGPAILARARELSADYIVMGLHDHGALHDLTAGSTTRRVLQTATCPVLVIPPGVAIASRRAPLEQAPAAVGDPSPASPAPVQRTANTRSATINPRTS